MTSEPRGEDAELADVLRRIDAGEEVDPGELSREHPELADELAAYLEMAELVESLAGSEASDVEVAPPVEEEVLRVFGEYELLEEVGRGGMGIVYKARQVGMDRLVAVKVVQSGGFASETELKRFYAEARAAGRLRHPNVVNVHEVGDVDGRHFFSMDFVDGPDLRELCLGKPLDARRAAEILKTVAEAIQSAHDDGILHRDLKPANILVDPEGTPHVTDFGLAKHLGDDSQITTTGTTLGTPSYMSPEAARGERVGPAADVYSLGAILYAMLSGRPPFRGTTSTDTVLQVLGKEPEPLPNLVRGVPLDLATIAHTCLEKAPERRYASAADLARDLERYLEGRPVDARRTGPLERARRWLRDVPLVAGLTGRTNAHPTAWHRRAQQAFVAGLVVAAAALVWFRPGAPKAMPDEVRIAAAVRGGEYFRLGEALGGLLGTTLARPVHVLETEGSFDNRDRLLEDETDLALLQASAIHSARIAVVAPLYDDLVHVVVRRGAGLDDVRDLAGKRVSIGLAGSGMGSSARRLLAHFGLTPAELLDPHVHFTVLVDPSEAPPYVAAIVTTGEQNEDLGRVLSTGAFQLLSIDEADREALSGPIFRQRTIPAERYGVVPDRPLRTVATTTFLACDRRAADELVTGALEALYGSQLVETFDLIPRESASDWRMLDLHPAARRFLRDRER